MSNGQTPMINVGGSNLPPEILAQQQQLNRQQQMAQLLMQQGMNQPSGQMVSGRYVAPSFFQYAAPLLQTFVGQRLQEKGDKAMLDLARQLREQETKDIEKFAQLQRGTPAVAEQYTEMAGPFGEGVGPNNADIPMPVAYRPAQAAVAPNRVAALQFAAQSTSPTLRQAGLKAMTEGPIKVGVEDTLLDPMTLEPVRTGQQKSPADIQTAAIVLGLDKKPIAEWTDQDRANIDAQIQKTRRSGADNSGGQRLFDNTLKLRSDFRSEPVYKGFQEIESAYSQINKSLDQRTAAGDLAASTKLMKLLDPTSVVRESELAMAMRATGKLDQLYNYANQIATGKFLNPTQVKEFRALAREFYTTAYDQYNAKRDEYVGIAERNQLNVEDVVGKPPKPAAVEQPPKYATNPTTNERIVSTDGGKTWKPVPKAR